MSRRPLLRQAGVALLFALGFVAAYLSVPTNPTLGGAEGFQLRPEPVVLPAALLLGPPAVLGTAVGVLVHNLAFRLVPTGVTLLFGTVQAGVVAGGGLLAWALRSRRPGPLGNLAATWVLSLSLVGVLGVVAAAEYGTAAAEEAEHILREVLLPINVVGFALLEAVDRLRGRGTPPRDPATVPRARDEASAGDRDGGPGRAFLGRAPDPPGRTGAGRPLRLLPLTSLLLLLLLVAVPSHGLARCFGTPGDVDRLWEVPVRASTAEGATDTALFGAAEGATNLLDRGLDRFEPIATEETEVRVFLFLPQVLNFPPANLNQSFLAPKDRMTWDLRVDLRTAGPSEVTLEWDASNVETADPPVTLRLARDGDVIDMRVADSFSFETPPGIAEFTVVAEEVEEDPLPLLIFILAGYGGAVGAYLVWRRLRRGRPSVKGSRNNSP